MGALLYKPEYCEQIIEFSREHRMSFTAFAGSIGVSRNTIDNWQHNYPEFREACQVAKAVRTWRIEAEAMNPEISGPALQARLCALRNTAPDEWMDKSKVEHSGPDGGAIPHVIERRIVRPAAVD